MSKVVTKSEENALTKVDTSALAVVETGYEGYEGAGFENQDKEDYSIPFIGLLQALSPQCDTLEGAKAGKIINTVTNDLFSGTDGIVFVPCATKHVFVEWKTKEQGGGVVATHEVTADMVFYCKEKQEFGTYKTPQGHDLVETFYVYGVIVTENGGEQAVMAFKSTQIKKYRSWMTKARGIQITIKDAAGNVVKRINPPLFAHKYRLRTTKEKNSKGEFYNWDISFDGADAVACRIAPNSELFQSCIAVQALVAEGKAKVDTNGQEATSTSEASGGDADVPF